MASRCGMGATLCSNTFQRADEQVLQLIHGRLRLGGQTEQGLVRNQVVANAREFESEARRRGRCGWHCGGLIGLGRRLEQREE